MKLSAFGDSQYNAQTGEWNDFHPWEPGVEGKGLLYVNPDTGEIELETWAVDAIGTPYDDGYHHYDMADRLGAMEVWLAFSIWSDGTMDGSGGGGPVGQNTENYALATRLDPRLKMPTGMSDDWRFGNTDHQDVLNWEPGREGKGIVIDRYNVHTWDVEEYETHWDYIRHLDSSNQVDEYFWINPNGEITHSGIMPLNPVWIEIITEADPRLWHDSEKGRDWDFG